MKADRTGAIRQFCLIALVSMLAWPLLAQERDQYKTKPVGHEQNQQLATNAYQANLKKYVGDTNILVLPGLIADKNKQRIEVMVESTGLNPKSPCEFTIVGEQSEHAYETLLIAFAQPSAIYQALQFIGKSPGEPADPEALRFWARGECFELGLVKDGEPPVRLEKLVLDKRTGKTLPETGFRFTGSTWVADPKQRGKKSLAADVYQPMAIVSLFNTPGSVLEVPYVASKEDVYQNTTANPEHSFPSGALMTLVLEPVKKEAAKGVKDLSLTVAAGNSTSTNRMTGLERIKSLSFQLKDAAVVLNEQPTISSVMQALGALDRKKVDYYLTLSFADNVELGAAQALVPLLAIMDSERGIRIEPPPTDQLYYRAFTPDKELLNRDTRMFHPWELALSDEAGAVSGRLLAINSVYTNGSSQAKLEITELKISSPLALRKAMDAEAAAPAKSGQASRPPVMMVFAPATLKYGQLLKFLGPVLPAHKTVHVYLDEPMPPFSGN